MHLILQSSLEKKTKSDFKRRVNENGKWSEGPTLKYKRKNHAVGVVTDKSTLKRLVVVTGGVGEEGKVKPTEILLKDSWSIGEK